MKTVQKFAPESGALTEQFDRATGKPVSCELAWSHAAMITAADSRRKAILALGL
jgi:glucoamylase